MRRTAAVVALVVALGACGTAEEEVPEDAAVDATPTATPTAIPRATPTDDGETATPTPLATDDPAVQDAILLTAVDDVLAPTRFSDLVDEDPGAFLEAAATICAALDDGNDAATVLRGFLTTLREEGLDLDRDSAYLGGALLGAAVTVRCPEHEAALAEVLP